MNRLYYILMPVVLALTACQRDDEILRTPPAGETPAPKGETLPVQPSLPSLDPNTDAYQYGAYKNMPYRILAPRHYNPARAYPLHVFLHGIGESGTDNEQQLQVGASYFQADSIREDYPAFIVFPQCPKNRYWFDDAAMDTLRGLISSLAKSYPISEKKISIGGFSMGAYGTFAMVARYPFFEAAVAISGAGQDDKAYLMSNTKWRIFAGSQDNVVPSTATQRMALALEDAGATVTFTLYPEADHFDTWVTAFSEHDFFYWLFSETP